MMSRRFRRATGAAFLAVAIMAASSCGEAVRQGRAPSYLIIDQLTGASGAKPKELTNIVESDVLTYVKQQIAGQTVLVPTIFEDPGLVQMHLSMKDPAIGPTEVNSITIERYHIRFVRSDGRSSEGVDVPYAFDGGATGTVTATTTSIAFVLVRAQAKMEAPLMALRDGGPSGLISTIAEITFYGHDQAGTPVTVTGKMSVNFANWGDPQT